MPTLDENERKWDQAYDWPQGGDEWSEDWGGADMQWHGTLLPRLHRYLPAATVLEIAPGHGRWTNHLKDLARRLVVVDLSERCIAACRERFATCPHIEYHVNDGRSLAFVEDGSVDLAFSFDSLVHAEIDVLEAYTLELARKLSPSGVAFLHHSNMGEHGLYNAVVRRLRRGRGFLTRLGLLDPAHLAWRATTVTASGYRRVVERAGLLCLSQEIFPWRSRRLIDCITVLTRPGSVHARGGTVLRNPDFMREAAGLRRLARLYGA